LFFSLESIHGQTQKTLDEVRVVKKNRKLCYEYKNAISLEEVDVRYVTIQCWWYFSRAIDETGFQDLENWFSFFHFHVRQWGGFMIHVLFSTFPHISSFTPYS
jgi:hypothetical protein